MKHSLPGEQHSGCGAAYKKSTSLLAARVELPNVSLLIQVYRLYFNAVQCRISICFADSLLLFSNVPNFVQDVVRPQQSSRMIPRGR